MSEKRVLIVVTSHGDIRGVPTTGVWFSEFSEPYALLLSAGVQAIVASPHGGPVPVDPRAYPKVEEIAGVRDALACLNATQHLSQMQPDDFDGIFMPGGHGPMFDLATDPTIKLLISEFWRANKPVGAVCHGPAALLNFVLSKGTTLLQGRRVTGFSQLEDAEDVLFKDMPFSLQERMEQEGAHFVEGPAHQPHVEVDGLLVTGQNPASAKTTTQAFLEIL